MARYLKEAKKENDYLKTEIEELKKFPQRIENENGTATKYEDGTMICKTSNPGNNKGRC